MTEAQYRTCELCGHYGPVKRMELDEDGIMRRIDVMLCDVKDCEVEASMLRRCPHWTSRNGVGDDQPDGPGAYDVEMHITVKVRVDADSPTSAEIRAVDLARDCLGDFTQDFGDIRVTNVEGA